MKDTSGVYCIENMINHKKYIGLSIHIKRRWNEHKNSPFNPNCKEYNYPLYKAIRKYGIENFSFTILEECSDEEVMKQREIYWIAYFNTTNSNYGYNMTKGGDYHCKEGQESNHAKLTKQEVIFCREKYAEGCRSKDIYERYFQDKIKFSGFQRMWHGKTWKSVMPEVFENNPHPRRKITDEDVLDIRTKYLNGTPICDIAKEYKDKYNPATVLRTIKEKNFCPLLWPNIEDNHTSPRYKVTPEDVRLIRQLKKEGYLHKDIKKALNDRISLTTISDIVTGKRYFDIE